jgi:hypothetical protein
MSVAEKGDGHGVGKQRFDGIAQTHHVLVFVMRGAMRELHSRQLFKMQWALRQRAQPLQVRGHKLLARPKRGQSGSGVELFKIHQPSDGFIVIAANEYSPDRPATRHHFVRIGTISDCIPEIYHQVVRRRRCKASLERFEIAVNVAKQENSHVKAVIIAFPALSRRDAGGAEVDESTVSAAPEDSSRDRRTVLSFTSRERTEFNFAVG